MNLHLAEGILLIFVHALPPAIIILAVWFVIESIRDEF